MQLLLNYLSLQVGRHLLPLNMSGFISEWPERSFRLRTKGALISICLVQHKGFDQKQWSEVFYKKAVLKNFAIFTWKHLCWSLFLIKLQAYRLQAYNFIKKRLQYRYFPGNIAKLLKHLFRRASANGCFFCLILSDLFN